MDQNQKPKRPRVEETTYKDVDNDKNVDNDVEENSSKKHQDVLARVCRVCSSWNLCRNTKTPVSHYREEFLEIFSVDIDLDDHKIIYSYYLLMQKICNCFTGTKLIYL